jgi:pyrroloquinoline-quinone synthase
MSEDREAALAPDAFEARIRRLLDERYHHRHPFHLRMYAGELTHEELRTWVRNRYYYQTRIPIKDGMILAKSRDPGFRRQWIRRIHDHDGSRPGEGGLSLWLELAEAVGLDRAEVEATRDVLPGVRRTCDDYVRFVESHDLLESVASSLTELSAADFMARRVEAFEQHYPWIATRGLDYFRSRTQQARRDAEEGLRFVREEARTRRDQERCLAALATKCDILWRLLDAVDAAHARPHLARGARLRREGGDSLVLLPERAVRLSPSGSEILELCDGERSALEIAEVLCARHPEEDGVADDAHDFLAEMRRLGVLEAGAA